MSRVQITLCHKDDSCASWTGCEERPKWCMVSYTYDTVHTHTKQESSLYPMSLWRRWRWGRRKDLVHNLVLSTPWSDIVPRGILWRNLRGQASCNLSPWMPGILALRDIFLSCVLDLQSPCQLNDFMSGVLFNITHRSQVSLVLGCYKYWLYVFIRLPLCRKTDV